MKNKLFILLTAVIFVSCSGYFDKAPSYALNADDLSSSSYPAVRIGLYDGIQNGWNLFWLTEDNSADNLIYRTSFWQHGEFDDNNITLANGFPNTDWGLIYKSIVACNKFLVALNKESDKDLVVNGITINQYIADARVIRAYNYWWAIKLWGDVPYIDESTTVEQAASIQRSPVLEIIPKMIADLKFGQENYRPYKVSGPKYLSKEAATALLARLYLYQNDFTNAGTEAEKVIASADLAITNNYLGIWRRANDKELIFFITSSSTDQSPHGFYLRAESNKGRLELPVDPALVEDFAKEPADSRIAVIEKVPEATNPKFGWQSVKYNNADNSDMFPVARVAEMYLISAEAQGYPAGLGRLNDLRAMRNLPALTTATITNVTQFAEAVMRERRLELCFEGHRFSDLRRMCTKYNLDIQTYLPNIKDINDSNLWYPIPLEQIIINPNLKQNQGY